MVKFGQLVSLWLSDIIDIQEYNENLKQSEFAKSWKNEKFHEVAECDSGQLLKSQISVISENLDGLEKLPIKKSKSTKISDVLLGSF